MIKRTMPSLLILSLCLVLQNGCAKKEVTPKQDSAAATVKTEKPAAAVKPSRPAPPAEPQIITGPVINSVVAVVNDDIITLYEVNREAQPVIRENEKRGALDEAAKTKIRRAALEGLIDKKLGEQKVKELNIKVTDDEIRQSVEDVRKQNNMTQEVFVAALAAQGLSLEQYRTQLREQLEKLKLVSAEVRSRIQVGETEMREHYEANIAKYSEEDTFRARHIFFRVNEKTTADELKRAMTTALLVLSEAKSDKDFAELAKTYSEDPAARKDGGDLGQFKKGDMQPELAQAIMGMKSGEVSELVYTPAGFHIIKVEERIVGKPKPFEKVKAEIEEALYRKKSEERFAQWVKDIRSKATIEIKEGQGL